MMYALRFLQWYALEMLLIGLVALVVIAWKEIHT